MIAVCSHRFAGEDLDLEVLFPGLWREADYLAGEPAVGLRIGRGVFEFGGVCHASQPQCEQRCAGLDGQ
ncbi:hypothetical protein D3C73_1569700 [compost metagenome]